jgi:hypothetical protein
LPGDNYSRFYLAYILLRHIPGNANSMSALLNALDRYRDTLDTALISNDQLELVYSALVGFHGSETFVADLARNLFIRRSPSEGIRHQLLHIGVQYPKHIYLVGIFNSRSQDDLDLLYKEATAVLDRGTTISDEWAITMIDSGIALKDGLLVSVFLKCRGRARVIESVAATRIPIDKETIDAAFDNLLDRFFEPHLVIPVLEALTRHWMPSQRSIDALFEFAIEWINLYLLTCLIQSQLVPTRDTATNLFQTVLNTLSPDNAEQVLLVRLLKLRPDMFDIVSLAVASTGKATELLILANTKTRPSQDVIDAKIESAALNGRFWIIKAILELDLRPSHQAIARIVAQPFLQTDIYQLFTD